MCLTCYRNHFWAVSLLGTNWMTARIATCQQKFWKMSTAWQYISRENSVHVWQLG